VLQTFFGLQPALPTDAGPGGGVQAVPLVDKDVPRGFAGVAKGFAWAGKAVDVVSTGKGLLWQPQQ
jgi:hypothetical protein